MSGSMERMTAPDQRWPVASDGMPMDPAWPITNYEHDLDGRITAQIVTSPRGYRYRQSFTYDRSGDLTGSSGWAPAD